MVNGEKRQVEDGLTAAGLLTQLGVQPERVVVEVNLTILKREELASTVLKAGDQVEIVHFVGGGSETAASFKLQATGPKSHVRPEACGMQPEA